MAGNSPLTSRPPPVDEALIHYLKSVFKPTLSAEFQLRDYDRQVGHQQVIEHLTAVYDMQQLNER